MLKVKSMVITALLFICFISMPIQAKSVTSSEYQAVVDTAYNYFNGAAKGDQALLAKAFDLEFGHVKMIRTNKETGKETIRTLTLQEFSAFFKQATTDTWQANILSVDVVDDKMAMVKLDFKTSKSHYIDYLVMYKRDNNWRIINKTFVAK
ncbi:nuclear transport factor 2 family protein [Colwellia psychrerythraea]|uniref:Lumazine-binding protein n=1 Tax=Colwellia psychrerythraea TaxID=28229 RepID=A0A099KUB1_COLPS|nr:nuclear transport factor 2 family protein [Colwellia psychrerythraea]KGJ93780.1 hypothetical protein GAB14E_2335 [Colwellia psychrerythraea]